MTNTFILIFQN